MLDYKDAGELLMMLEPVVYNYKRIPNEERLGFISEDVPEIISSTDRKGLNSMDIVAVLTKVVQQQLKDAEEQKKVIAELENRIREMEKRQMPDE